MKRVALAAMLGLMAFAPAQAATTVTYLNIATGNDFRAARQRTDVERGSCLLRRNRGYQRTK